MKMEPSTTPRRSTRKSLSFSSRSSHNKETKNPYSASGLDKFSALLAELEQKRQRIYSQVNPDEISLVRFVFKDSDDCVPIVVKMKKNIKDQTPEQQQQQEGKTKNNIKQSPTRKQQDSDQVNDHGKSPLVESSKQQVSEKKTTTKKKISWRRFYSFWRSEMLKLSNWRQPSCYLPAVIVLILLFLVFFGRSFAILCTSIGWYVVPALQENKSPASNNKTSKSPSSSSSPNVIRKPVVRKEYLRIYSDNKMLATHKTHHHHSAAPSPKKHGHKKSW